MKKVVFAIQIFSLLALLPAYMILELNRKTAEPLEHKTEPVRQGSPAFENQDSESMDLIVGLKSKTAVQP